MDDITQYHIKQIQQCNEINGRESFVMVYDDTQMSFCFSERENQVYIIERAIQQLCEIQKELLGQNLKN